MDARRRVRFYLWLAVLFAVPVLIFIPYKPLQGVLFFPWLIWVNVVGLPLAMVGAPGIEVHEFGAYPRGVVGWSLIVLPYIAAAFFLSMIDPRGPRTDDDS